MGESESRKAPEEIPLEKINEYAWRIPKYKSAMRVPGMVFANEALLEKMKTDRTLWQCTNVTQLPGIYKYASNIARWA